MITPSFSITATERVLPKLALDFTTASLDSRVTFTRTTSASNPATYVGSNGYIAAATNNQPRFDYNPIALTCKGLLIEESRANLCLYSEGFSDTSWVKGAASIVSNAAASPDGNNNSFFLKEDSNLTSHSINRSITTAINTTYVVSLFAKPAVGTRYLTLSIDGTSTAYASATFDLTTGQSTQTLALGYTGTAGLAPVVYADGSVRCAFVTTTNATAALTLRISMSSTSTYTNFSRGLASYQGDGTSGVYIWGAQLEAGAFATSYIPTTTTALTRNADVATMTGTNFSDWFNASEGTLYSKCSVYADSSNFRRIASINEGVGNEVIYSGVSSGYTGRGFVIDGGATQASFSYGSSSANTQFGLALAYKLNDIAGAMNGGTVSTDNAATLPTVDRLNIGNQTGSATSWLNGHVQKIMYWPIRLANSEVRAFSK